MNFIMIKKYLKWLSRSFDRSIEGFGCRDKVGGRVHLKIEFYFILTSYKIRFLFLPLL